jgi:hypothetical protein
VAIVGGGFGGFTAAKRLRNWTVGLLGGGRAERVITVQQVFRAACLGSATDQRNEFRPNADGFLTNRWRPAITLIPCSVAALFSLAPPPCTTDFAAEPDAHSPELPSPARCAEDEAQPAKSVVFFLSLWTTYRKP